MRPYTSSRFPRWIILVLLTGIMLGIPATVFANVTLVDFIPSEEDGYVRLDWETATEIDTAGFFIWRSTTGGNMPGDYAIALVTNIENNYTDPNGFIPPEGNLIGAVYAYADHNVTPGTTYHYFLQALENTGDSQFFGPYTITLPGGAPTSTPTATPTATPSLSPTATQLGATAVTPSITPTPTNTLTRTPVPPTTVPRTSTPVPTSPPFNTVTPTRTNAPTPGPSPTLTLSPTVTPSPSVTMAPLDLTLTAVMAQVSPLPTYTLLPPTRTPFPTWTPTSSPTSAPITPGVLDGVSSTGLLGVFLAGFLFISGGGFITFFLFLARKK